jgi:hypothetical protein
MSLCYGTYKGMDINSLRTDFTTYANSKEYSVVFECNEKGEYWKIKASTTEQGNLDAYFNSEYKHDIKWNVTNRSATNPNTPITSTVDNSTTPPSIDTQSIEIHYHVFVEDKTGEMIIQATGRCAKCDQCIDASIGKSKMHKYCHLDIPIPKYNMKRLFTGYADDTKALAKRLFDELKVIYSQCYLYCPINEVANRDICKDHHKVMVAPTVLNHLIKLKSTKAYVPPKAAAESPDESSASLHSEPEFNFYHLPSIISHISSSDPKLIMKIKKKIDKKWKEVNEARVLANIKYYITEYINQYLGGDSNKLTILHYGYISLQYLPESEKNKKDYIYTLLEVIKKNWNDPGFKKQAKVIKKTESDMITTYLMRMSSEVEPIDGSLEAENDGGSSIYITRNKKRKKKSKKKKSKKKKTKKKKLKRKIKSKRKS